jgi:hypothetical protein
LGSLGRVAGSGGADSMLRFWLERGGNGMKHCQKMKGGSELILAQWEGSVTWHDSVATSTGGETAPGRGKGGDDAS